jgi:hypothetical protein
VEVVKTQHVFNKEELEDQVVEQDQELDCQDLQEILRQLVPRKEIQVVLHLLVVF